MDEPLPPALPLDVIPPEVAERRLGVLEALPETGVPDTLGLLMVAIVLAVIGIAAHRFRR